MAVQPWARRPKYPKPRYLGLNGGQLVGGSRCRTLSLNELQPKLLKAGNLGNYHRGIKEDTRRLDDGSNELVSDFKLLSFLLNTLDII